MQFKYFLQNVKLKSKNQQSVSMRMLIVYLLTISNGAHFPLHKNHNRQNIEGSFYVPPKNALIKPRNFYQKNSLPETKYIKKNYLKKENSNKPFFYKKNAKKNNHNFKFECSLCLWHKTINILFN